MALDPARQYIDDVHVRLAELFDVPDDFYKVGGLTFAHNDAPPIIKWRFGRITHEPSTVVGSIGTEVQELTVRIWHVGADPDESEANTRTLKNQLMLACRQIAQQTEIPDPIAFSEFDWNEEAHVKHGRFLEGTIDVKFAMPNEVFPTALMAKTQITQHADYDGDGTNDETVHTTADFTEGDDGFPEAVP
jgi:hypothetical protein